MQNGGTIEIQSGSLTSEKTDLQSGVTTFNGKVLISGGAKLTGPDTKTTFGSKSSLQLLAGDAGFEAKGDLSLGGSLHFPISSTGNPVVQVGGAASVNTVVSPTFDGVAPEFGNSFTFLEGDSVELGSKTSVELPAGVSLGLGLEARVVTDGKKADLTFSNLPVLEVHRATGASKIMNVVGGPITITGYAIESALGTMNPESFSGFGGDDWDRPNPVNTSVAEFSLTGDRTLEVGDTLEIGNAYNGGATHPLDEDVAFRFVSPSGEIREGLVQYTGPANDLVLNVNPDTGEITVQNLSSFIDPVEVTGYTISSPSGALKAADLTSFSDTGAAGEGWSEANPDNNLISELNLSSSKSFGNGTVISLGNIFDTAGARDIAMEYSTVDEIISATVEYQTSMGPVVPTCEDLKASRIPGDANGNNEVEFTDFLALANNFGGPGGYEEGNFDCLGNVEFVDFLTLANNFGSTGAATAAVPEPSSNCLLGLGGMLLLAARRRRRGNQVKTRTNLSLLLFLPALAVMCSQANAQVCELDDCPIDELRVFTGEVVNITGPADLVSLRQPNNILYAVNVWGDELERVVNGVSFWSDKEDVNPDGDGLDGYRTDWTHNVTNWQAKPEFGDTEDDDELEFIMTDIRWTDNSPAAHPDPGVGSHFAVNTGDRLYLELLISGGHDENRIWDIYIDGEPVVSEFDSTNHEDYDQGVVLLVPRRVRRHG